MKALNVHLTSQYSALGCLFKTKTLLRANTYITADRLMDNLTLIAVFWRWQA